jgi:hypothetical protein
MLPIYEHLAVVPSALETDTGVFGAAANVFYQKESGPLSDGK